MPSGGISRGTSDGSVFRGAASMRHCATPIRDHNSFVHFLVEVCLVRLAMVSATHALSA